MLFNSYIFVILLLPLSIFGFFILNKLKSPIWARAFLLGMSYWFYGYFNKKYLLLIISSVVINYIIYRFLLLNINRKINIMALGIGIIYNLGLLFIFKYYNFFIENINQIFQKDLPLHYLLLPLGISFFTFQQISFIIDTYKGKVEKHDISTYALFVTYFPQLIAGPIVTHDELIPQFNDQTRRKVDWHHIAQGSYIFVWGLAKKVLVADTFGNIVNWGYNNLFMLDSSNAIIVMLSYTIQIYFDFSGYSDMAIGIAKMMNIDLPLNFNSPYKAVTITEFWDRWHITLTRFFTKYIYIPLGGNRKGNIRTYINLMIVFLISGFWHGANWTFIIWGGLHGLFCIFVRCRKNFFEKIHPVLNWLFTFIFINFTWVIFRANSIADAMKFFAAVFSFNFTEINENIISCLQLPEFVWISGKIHFYMWNWNKHIFLLLIYAGVYFCILQSKSAYERMQNFEATIGKSITTAVLLTWCIFSFSGISTFLYFNF